MNFTTIIKAIKMFYSILCYAFSIISFFLNIIWLCFTLASAGIPWFALLFIFICVGSKFVKLKSPDNKTVFNFFGEDWSYNDFDSGISGTDDSSVVDNSFWPIANKGGAFDAPENSVAALKKCVAQNCKMVLLDLGFTKCGELIILHKSTIAKTNHNGPVNQVTFESLQNFNISEHHPLSSQFAPEKILSLANLLTLLETMNISVFLLLSTTSSKCLDELKKTIKKNEIFSKRIVICSTSAYAIYQLRKSCPDLICGLWIDKSTHTNGRQSFFKTSTLLSVYGALFRNIVIPVIGISAVFINKDEFNAHIQSLWKNVGTRPIVYPVNSPNEKRYFQKVIKTQYVTDSLRSEPQLFYKSKRK